MDADRGETAMNIVRKTLTAALAAAVVAGGVLASATDADAGPRRHHRGDNGAVIAGIIGGLAVGAIAASAARSHRRAQRHHYYDPHFAPAPVYHGYHQGFQGHHYGFAKPRRVYADPLGEPHYDRHCWNDKKRVFDEYGNYVGRKLVRICH